MIRKTRERVKKFWASLALLSVEMALIVGVFAVSLVAFVFLVRRVFVIGDTQVDQRVFAFLQDHVTPRNNEIMLFITYLGRHEFLIPANLVLIAYYLFIKKHRWYSIKIPATAISSVLLMFVLKNLFGRERPLTPLLEEAKGLSFPSGHALMSVTFYGLLIYIVWHEVKDPVAKWTLIVAFLILIHLIAFSRIYLRVHYTTDVIAGLAMGFIWLVFSLKALRRLEKYSRRNVAPMVEEPPATTQAAS
jgi:membrane-associated phospholipid phosphatase